MIPGLALLVWGYVVARLLQVPVEYHDATEKDRSRVWIIIVSAVGILIASAGLLTVWTSAARVPTP